MSNDNVRVTATDREGRRLRQQTVINHQPVIGVAKQELLAQFPDAYIFVNYPVAVAESYSLPSRRTVR